MSTLCITNCVNDARAPMRATYVNLNKWPESDAELVKKVGFANMQPTRVVSSVSCRQMYLRSYTFSKKESVPEKTKKCFGKFTQRVATGKKKKKKKKGMVRAKRRRSCSMVRMKNASFSAFSCMFHKLLSCTATVDVVDR